MSPPLKASATARHRSACIWPEIFHLETSMSSAVASKMDALTVHQTADLVAFSAAAKSDSFDNIAARIAFTINKNASGGEKLKGSKINQGVQSQKQSTLTRSSWHYTTPLTGDIKLPWR